MKGLTPLEFATLGLATNGDCQKSRTGPPIDVPTMHVLIARGLLELKACPNDRCPRERHLWLTEMGRIAMRLPRSA